MLVLDLILVSIFGLSTFSNFYGLPGNLSIVLSSLLYGVATGFSHFSFSFLLLVLAVFLLFELLEFLLIFLTARKFGSSKWGVAGAIAGGILGAVSGAFFTPVMGAITGSVLGVFIGAFTLEFIKNRNVKQSLRGSFGAFLGKMGGLSLKTIGAVTMASMVLTKII